MCQLCARFGKDARSPDPHCRQVCEALPTWTSILQLISLCRRPLGKGDPCRSAAIMCCAIMSVKWEMSQWARCYLFHQPIACQGWHAAGASRVLKTGAQRETSELSGLLQHGRRAGDYSRLMAYLKGVTPSRLDNELRSMQV